MMKQILLLLMLCCIAWTTEAQKIYEDFEGGTSKAAWTPFNGLAYEAVANPSKDAVNGSDFVGKFTNDGISDFCFGLADIGTPADLSELNLIKIKIWSPVATKALLKFEGGGKFIEKFIDITQPNEWVEYVVDFSAAAGFTTMNKILLAFNPFTTPEANTFYVDDITGNEAIQVYETFETGNEMAWNALDGSLVAPTPNPDANKINPSAQVGKYTKSGAHAYSLLLAERSSPFDLSILNQFRLHIYSDAPSQALLKLEGPGGPPVEKIVNLGVRNAWQEYNFDFSSAASFKHLTKAVIFFDPGVETSADDYYFDNLYALPLGKCAGVAPIPDMVDDFECSRNATYVNGWDSLTVVDNPAPNPVNNTSQVGKYVDPQGEEWAALLIDYQNPIDLSLKNQLNIKLWSAKATRVLFKLEGGSSPAVETWVDVNEINQWVDYAVDFSAQALASHKKLVMFFNAGNLPSLGDTYYIDQISWGEKTTTDLENFENGAVLPWEPLDQLTVLHGSFEVINNPDATGQNTSSRVGKYTKGSSAFSTLSAVAPGVIDISSKPQFNLDVWAPLGSTSVTMQLESPSSGNKSVERDIKTPGKWETLSFDFSDFQTINDWEGLKLIFNPAVAESGAMFFFDNLNQSASTVDPCENVVVIANIIDDFECQRNKEYGAGVDFISAVNNPKLTSTNSSTKVGLYKDQPNEPWSALCANFPDGIDLSVFNQLELQVLATNTVPVLLKLEGGSSPPKEIFTDIKVANDWNNISVDFSGESGKDHKRVCFFFNAGVTTSVVDDYYIDNIRFAHAPYNSCIMNFDDPAFVSSSWRYFPADNSGAFEIVANPLIAGINKSALVGKATERASGEQPWQGMYTDLESYIAFGSNTLVKMKVLSPKVGAVTMKIEKPLAEGFPGGSGDNTVTNTKANEWEELTFDFATAPTPIDPAGRYARVTLIWDINNLPAEDVVYYFDDIKLEGGSCGESPNSTYENELKDLTIYPNPVHDLLRIHHVDQAASVEIYNIFGQKLSTIHHQKNGDQWVDVSNLTTGTYIIISNNQQNQAIAKTRFVKM